jgi:YidC/Oxa1 family membrane protein insertase
MEKRAIIAILLSVLVLLAFRYFEQRRQGPPEARRPAVQTQKRIPDPSTQTAPGVPTEVEAVKAEPLTGDTDEKSQTVMVEGDLYRAVIDNRGAVIKSWELKKYKSAQGRVFEMIAAGRDRETWSFPGSMLFEDSKLTSLANGEFYQVSVDGRPEGGTALAPPVTVVLKLKRGDFQIEKRFSFEKDKYLIDLSAAFNKGGKPLEGHFLLGQDIGPEQEHLLGSMKLEAVYYADGKARREGAPKEEKEIKKIGGNIRWAGLDMHYFSIIAIPSQPLAYIDIQRLPAKAVGLDGKQVDRDLIRLTTPVNGSMKYQLYLGPKKQSDLQAVRSADITGVINYGMFTILVLPLLASLRWIYQYVHNYGHAIIILTFLLSLLLFPFRLKQIVSMKKMQVVQPKVKAIQEKYRRYKKTDPKRTEMNQEIMALYKEHNVNPLGGCLPLVLQFPLLFAFYSLLANSIELRQAPFIGWLQDLSVKDPYYVLPIIMGITMFVSQKMTPMAPGTDPTQAKVMMVMPLVFTVMMINLSSGLNLYFLCSNIFQIGFQKIAERWMGDRKSGESKA